jgi:ElaB/YqjD/DUF883 family membrane-anchored ribosome-binding protein
MKKRIWGILGAVVTVGAVMAMASTSHSWAKDHFQGGVLQSTAAVFNITDMNIAQEKANNELKKVIDDLEESLKDIKSQAVEKQLKRLKKRWEEDRKRLDNAINTREQMIAKMAKRQIVTMR